MPGSNGRVGVEPAGELVIFDCDGVLVDTERLSARVGARVLTALGWPLTEADMVERFLGCSDEYFLAEVERALGRRLPADWEAPFQPWYDEAYARELAAVPGIVDVLDRLTVPTCVASNGGHDKMRRTLGAAGLYDRFAGRIFSAEDVVRGKPAPDLFLHAARCMGAEPRRCIVVEDSPRGVEAARAAGMRVVAYAGLVPRERLAGPATVVVDGPDELSAALAALGSLGSRGSGSSR